MYNKVHVHGDTLGSPSHTVALATPEVTSGSVR